MDERHKMSPSVNLGNTIGFGWGGNERSLLNENIREGVYLDEVVAMDFWFIKKYGQSR